VSSDVGFVQYVCDQMRDAGAVRYRKMFGEFAVYCDDVVVALICDDCLYVRPTPGGREFIGEPVEASPYPGSKAHFLIEGCIEDREWVTELTAITRRELPEPKPKKRPSA
jgi:TfoX/Sxy family transcriptional regulator of competence genes